MALLTYYPEMQHAKPAAEYEARMNMDSTFQVRTRVVMSWGKNRGCNFIRTLTPSDLVPQAQDKVGMNEYRMTPKAFDRLCKACNVSMEILL